MTTNYEVIVADAARLDEVEPLFKAMVEHHRAVAGEQPSGSTSEPDSGPTTGSCWGQCDHYRQLLGPV